MPSRWLYDGLMSFRLCLPHLTQLFLAVVVVGCFLVRAPVVHAATLTVCASQATTQSGCQYLGGAGIQEAINAATNGDTILLKEGKYADTAPVINRSKCRWAYAFIDNKTLTISGEPGVVLDGTAAPVNACGIVVLGTSSVTIEDVVVTNFKTNAVQPGNVYSFGYGISLGENSKTSIRTSSFDSNEGTGIVISGNARLTADKISASYSKKMDGVSQNGQSVANIADSIFARNARRGLDVYKQGALTANHISVVENGAGGISIDGTPAVTVTNSIIALTKNRDANTPGFAVGTHDKREKLDRPSTIALKNLLVWQNAADGQRCGSHQICDFPGKVVVDPLFLNQVAGNYHLQPDSVACTGGENGTYLGASPCQGYPTSTTAPLAPAATSVPPSPALTPYSVLPSPTPSSSSRPIGDFNADGRVNNVDRDLFVANGYGTNNCSYNLTGPCPMSSGLAVNLFDLFKLINAIKN